jgi:hypothetical protein
MCRQGPCDGLITHPRSPTICVKKKKLKTEEEARVQQRAVEPLMNEYMSPKIICLSTVCLS